MTLVSQYSVTFFVLLTTSGRLSLSSYQQEERQEDLMKNGVHLNDATCQTLTLVELKIYALLLLSAWFIARKSDHSQRLEFV